MEVFISWWDVIRWVLGIVITLLFLFWPRHKKKS